MKFRRTYEPAANGIVTVDFENMISRTTIMTRTECKLQMRILGIWITVHRYSIDGEKFSQEQPIKIN